MTDIVSAVVLAAGDSARMGRAKLLLPLGGEPLVRRTVRLVCDAGFDDVQVVVGRHHAELLAALDGLPVHPVLNPDYATGLGSSFRTAVAHLTDSIAAMFAMADQPFLTTADYRRLLDTYRRERPAIVGVCYNGVTAPPHLFTRELFPDLAALQHGARPVLQGHRDRTIVLSFDAEKLFDIDTPEEYELARSRLSAER